MIRPKDRTNYNLADLFLFRAQIAAGDNRKVAQVLSHEGACVGSLFLLNSLDWNRSIDGDVAGRVNGYLIVRGVRHQSVADARLDSAKPIVATARGE